MAHAFLMPGVSHIGCDRGTCSICLRDAAAARAQELVAEQRRGIGRHLHWDIRRETRGHFCVCGCGPHYCVLTCHCPCILCGLAEDVVHTVDCPGERTEEQQMEHYKEWLDRKRTEADAYKELVYSKRHLAVLP